jgi:hypothetical protein
MAKSSSHATLEPFDAGCCPRLGGPMTIQDTIPLYPRSSEIPKVRSARGPAFFRGFSVARLWRAISPAPTRSSRPTRQPRLSSDFSVRAREGSQAHRRDRAFRIHHTRHSRRGVWNRKLRSSFTGEDGRRGGTWRPRRTCDHVLSVPHPIYRSRHPHLRHHHRLGLSSGVQAAGHRGSVRVRDQHALSGQHCIRYREAPCRSLQSR